MKKKILVFLTLVVIIAVGLCATAIAFDGNDYGGGGGGGDFGGGDYDFGDSSYSGGGVNFIGGGAGTVVIIIIIIVVIALSKKGKGGSSSGDVVSGQGAQGRFVQLPNRNNQIQEIIRKTDPNFSADDFVSFAKQVHIDIETAWCNRDLTPVRPVMHQNLYNTTQRQVEAKIQQGVIYHYESMAINTAYLTSFVRDKDYEYLTVYLNSRRIDYQTDEKTGNILKGDKTTRWDMRYKMKFIRTTGTLTKDKVENTHGYNCPNCGAPLEITSSGTCPYCNSVVTTGDYSWVLCDYTTVRDDTIDDGIRIPPEDQQ